MPVNRVSLVVPCFNVARYLPDFLDSLAGQGSSLDAVEVIFVDDGSSDSTPIVIETWLAERPGRGRLISQPNAGASAARNKGLAAVSTQWVSFPDPDDVLAPGYLDAVLNFLDADEAGAATAVATNLQFMEDGTGAVSDTHPLRRKFSHGERVVTLSDDPRMIQLSAASCFLRTADITSSNVRFDPDVRPNFEDAHFLARVFLSDDDPSLAVVPSARYHYRRRADESSLVQTSWSNPVKYDAVLRRGVLGLFDEATTIHGSVPRWLEYLAIYELQFYLRSDEKTRSGTAALTATAKATANDNIGAVLRRVSLDALENFDASAMQRWIRVALIARKTGRVPEEPVLVGPRDHAQGAVRLRYEFCGTRPPERFLVGGRDVTPLHSKDRALKHFDQVSYYERIVWLPNGGDIRVELGGRHVPTLEAPWYSWPPGVQRSSDHTADRTSGRGERSAGRRTRPERPMSRALRSSRRRLRSARAGLAPRLERLMVRAARTGLVRTRFADAWVLCDRDTQAHDNAEHLYRYLAAERPDINAWFALSRRSPDFERLRAEGFKLVDYGSRSHIRALLNARELISSQIDHYIVSPLPERWKRFGRWRFTFLQHGVTKDDLSRWLNSKDIALCIATTPGEYESFVADGTSYKLTTREVALTGQPRHDRLVRLARSGSSTPGRTVVFMPTWRRGLMGANVEGGNLRELGQGFFESEYFSRWSALVDSPALKELAERSGVRLIVMPHPNLEPYLAAGVFQPHIEVATYAASDFQQVVAHAGLVVTDYSSNAFEAAIARRSVLYYQFDKQDFFSGGHVYRKGYFDYEADGFGPVEIHHEGALARILEAISSEFERDPVYQSRADAAFVACDGTSSAKVVSAIEGLSRPLAGSAQARWQARA